jgi:hypothetical protein
MSDKFEVKDGYTTLRVTMLPEETLEFYIGRDDENELTLTKKQTDAFREWFIGDESWEDRSAIQGTNPGLAKLIKANEEIERLRKYVVQQHDYFTGKDVPDLIVTTGTDYEDVQE